MLEKIRFEKDGKIEGRMMDMDDPFYKGVLETWKAFGWTAKRENGKEV